jgi:hypothetical protein
MAVQNNKLLLHRKEWQMMTPAPVSTGAGTFIIKDPGGIRRTSLLVASATVQYIYDVDEDAWVQIPSMALAGTFAAGACGAWGRWSNTLTPTGGTTTTITITGNLSGRIVGKTVWFQAGTNLNARAVIDRVTIVPGGTHTIFLKTAVPNAVTSAHTFKIDSGVYYVLNAYTSLAAGVFKSYDVATGTVTTLNQVNLPASWGTDGRMVSTPSNVGVFVSGTANAGTSSTLVHTSKTWTLNQWSNYQVRIVSGTGAGQIRTISGNTANTLTVSVAWTVTPDSTSVYAIEGNDDFIYILGNGAVAMYRYTISTNSVAIATVNGGARSSAPGAGMSANWISITGKTAWQDENNFFDGRFIYSFRGAGTGTLHRYDIALLTWTDINYNRLQETFTTGSSFDADGSRIYANKEATGRFFYVDVVENEITGFSTDFYPQSTAVLGDKSFTVSYTDGTGQDIKWLYYLGNTSNILRRIMIY